MNYLRTTDESSQHSRLALLQTRNTRSPSLVREHMGLSSRRAKEVSRSLSPLRSARNNARTPPLRKHEEWRRKTKGRALNKQLPATNKQQPTSSDRPAHAAADPHTSQPFPNLAQRCQNWTPLAPRMAQHEAGHQGPHPAVARAQDSTTLRQQPIDKLLQGKRAQANNAATFAEESESRLAPTAVALDG